ncbi:MAG: hypothetical protein EOO56_01310 [Hymenobacter sp.]|nr:MAG: hypothetical protein EOO56_01310 [Hymenobacter sp.]
MAIFLTGLAAPAQAQQPASATIRLSPEDLERGQYGAQRNFFFLPPGKTGEDNYLGAGFFGQKLRPYLSSSPAAASELDKYSRQKTLFLVDRGLLLGSVVVYATQVFAHGDAQYFNSTQQVAAGVAVVSILATLFINRHTNDYLKQAVDNYNTDPPAKRHGALWPRLRPTGWQVAATPQGQPLAGLRWQL